MKLSKVNGHSNAGSFDLQAFSSQNGKLWRYLLSLLVVGSYLLLTLWTFQMGLGILKDVNLTGVALGLGLSIPVIGTYIKARKRLKNASKKVVPHHSVLDKIKKGHVKRQQQKFSNWHKLKNYFSFDKFRKKTDSKKESFDKDDTDLTIENHEDLSTNQTMEVFEEAPVIQPKKNEIILSKQVQKIRKNKTLSKKNTPKNTYLEIVSDLKQHTDDYIPSPIQSTDDESTSTEEIPQLIPVCTLESNVFFKSKNDNVYVDKKRLPEAFLKFSDLIQQLIEQDLILTGGAVTALILKTDKFSDLDCIIFEDQNKLLNLLLEAKPESIQYSCRIVSKKYPIIRVVLAEQTVLPCDYIYLPFSTETDFLNYPTQSSAAYIRTNHSLFYVNKMNNSCVEIKCHESVSTDSLCNKGMLKVLDKEMKRRSRGSVLSLYELSQITVITNHAHARLIEIDISCCKSEGDILENEIKKNLARRDFKISALFVKILRNYTMLMIRGFNGGISSVNHDLISPVDPKALFKNTEDILRIFRLANIMLQYPTFNPDDKLEVILKECDFKLIFENFFFKNGDKEDPDNISHLRQINTKLNKLFTRFGFVDVIKVLCKLDIIASMTGLTDKDFLIDTASDFENYIKTVPNHYKKTAFYYFLHLHCCLSSQKTFSKSLMNKVQLTLEPEVEASEFAMYIDFIERNTLNRMFPKTSVPFKPDPAFIKMLFDIKMKFKAKNQIADKFVEEHSAQQGSSIDGQVPLEQSSCVNSGLRG